VVAQEMGYKFQNSFNSSRGTCLKIKTELQIDSRQKLRCLPRWTRTVKASGVLAKFQTNFTINLTDKDIPQMESILTAKVIATVEDNLTGQMVTGNGIVFLVPNQCIIIIFKTWTNLSSTILIRNIMANITWMVSPIDNKQF